MDQQVHALLSFQFCVGPYLFRPAAILRSCSPCILRPQVRLTSNVALRFAFLSLFERFHVRFSRSWLLRLVSVEEASTWMSNLNRADTTSVLGAVCGFQTLTMNVWGLFL